MTNCSGLMGKVFGHRFEERYDQNIKGVPSAKIDDHLMLALGGVETARILEKLQDIKQTYVHDVCTRCGAIVKRGDTDAKG